MTLKKKQIDKLVAASAHEDDYIPFNLEDFFQNPVVLARMRAGVTQNELADLLGVTQSYISRLENEDVVSDSAMFKINQVLKDYPNRWDNTKKLPK